MSKKDTTGKDRQLNIAMLGHKRIPSREGGVEVVVEELSVRMAAKGHKVTCLNRSGHHVAGEKYDSYVGNIYKGVRLKNVLTINIKGFAAASSSFFGALRAAFGIFMLRDLARLCGFPSSLVKDVLQPFMALIISARNGDILPSITL